MRLHVEALFTHDAAGRLLRVNEPGGGPAPRFFLGRTRDGVVRRFRADVPEPLVRALAAASADADGAAERCAALLGAMAPVERRWAGPAFRCPPGLTPSAGIVPVGAHDAALLEAELPGWLAHVGRSEPLVALVANGRALALCGSGRHTSRAHEAALETAPAYRGRGAAGVVVAAWAHAVRALGAEPLYSTAWENRASLAVARKLALEPIGSDLHLT